MAFQDFVQQHQHCEYSQEHVLPQGDTIQLSENQTTYSYQYRSGETFLEIHVDGGMVQDNAKKCDYLLLNTTGMDTNEPNLHAIFIELKNKVEKRKFGDACKQLESTIERYSSELIPAILHSRIVMSNIEAKYPPKAPRIMKCKLRFKDDFNCFFDCDAQMVEYTGEDGHPKRE